VRKRIQKNDRLLDEKKSTRSAATEASTQLKMFF